MKTFEEIYEELQSSDNNVLNNAWKQAKRERKKSNKIALIVCLIIDILIIIFALKNVIVMRGHLAFIPIIFMGIVINLIIYAFTTVLFSKDNRDYTLIYKNIIINKLMSNFYNNLEYFPNKSMPEYIYENANYNEHYDTYESEDYFEANIKEQYSIQMAEILTQEEEEYTDSDGEEHTRTITVFSGLFGKIILNKSIKSELVITQNRAMLFNKERLEMDSSEFEKYFDVRASDKIIGMQILTADVMEELIAFQKNTNMEYDIVIKNNELYLRFHCGEMFEVGKLKNGPIDKELLKKYFYMLNFTYNLSNKIINVINDTII